jgi:Domain of unknown function (DUF3854)/Domain of unknown function (DUF927)
MTFETAAWQCVDDLRVTSVPIEDVAAGKENGSATCDRAAAHKPPSWGGPLSESDYETLAASWITREMADVAMLRRVDEYEGREIVGQKGKRDCSGILFPYYWPGEVLPFTYRIRRDNPEWTADKDGQPKAERKYLAPAGDRNRLFIPAGVTPEQLADLQIPIVLVEGEKKALALWRLANHDVEKPRFIPIAIAGVWNWRGIIGKTGGPKGERLDVRGPIADLSRVEWNGREVFIVFDTNVRTNESVNWARKGISRELAARGAQVDFVNLPEDCHVNGIDDLLAVWGPSRVLELFDTCTSGARLEIALPPQFQSKPEGLFRIISKGERLTQVQLTNYRAAITGDIRLDDGVETKCEFAISAELMGRRAEFTIPASQFGTMDWPIERLGAAAITFPNQRDYARTAIQALSMAAQERYIFAHTGWRNLKSGWAFLHAAGAICKTGALDVNVRLLGQMSRYELLLSQSPQSLASAVKASLRLIDLAPPAVSFPLLAATYRAVLGEADFALHVVGETGAFKSELAALQQQHFGVAMNRLHLPGAWSSTGNALERLAFLAKDALLVIDDFAPQGNSAEVARYHAAADRVFRAAGNQAGRSRLDSNAKLRESNPPRALILSTGEDIPRNQSVRARLLILELSRGSINTEHLSARQKDAQEGAYAEAMGGFVQWLARRHEEAWEAIGQKVSEYRTASLRSFVHARTPDIVANLQAAFELFLDFGVACGAMNIAERDRLVNRCWDGIGEAAAAQAKHHAATEPAARFLTLLRASLTSGAAHLAERSGGKPHHSATSSGWRDDDSGHWKPLGDCIGWVEVDDLYLEPTAAYRVAQKMARDTDEALTISEHTLKRRLRDRGLLASVDRKRETLTIRRTIDGTSKEVLHLWRTTLLTEDPEEEDEVGR